MGFLDTLFGRSKPAPPNLERLFSLPSAAVTLQADMGLEPSGVAEVGFKPASAEAFAELERQIDATLQADASDGVSFAHHDDEYGYRWVRLHAGGLEDVVTAAHMVNASLEAAGFGPQLLCSVFGFHDERNQPFFLVYLFKRGTFYPFAPRPGERRDNELELRCRGALAGELPLESDLSRWFPLWGLRP